jgi:uncharacterized protein YfbU (UPF0304 family)
MDRTLNCLISGNKYTFTKDYFNKKVEEYGNVEDLKKYFVTKKVRSLIERGYNVQEIRNILTVVESNLPGPDSQDVKDIMNYYSIRKDATKKAALNFATHKSDPDVAVLINNIKDLKL